ncbi:hypothetical protein PFICI_06284 [Pestalotiopsis fici W106-1]|uniref:Uncharacterized protein n=1 Tax=Pestalotiopsis fici (strain W106-1 / CGMCC3.15140) TaxID=1229662 RepID=W3X7C9_PESFW|nr:uncharacterized protein PFICI_06284 [Pestalotiopsis fici W106-1]ETS81282.1 hypothetical protein PFICI_06284 [Pestalotiopsis fici W106-1]
MTSRARQELLRHHPNAEVLLRAWNDNNSAKSFPNVLMTLLKPRLWLESSHETILVILSKVTLDSAYSGFSYFRKVRDHLDDAVKWGESVHWDTSHPYTGPLPSYEDIEAIRIVGSKVGGFGTPPQPISQ